jgi:hypothetical protein
MTITAILELNHQEGCIDVAPMIEKLLEMKY